MLGLSVAIEAHQRYRKNLDETDYFDSEKSLFGICDKCNLSTSKTQKNSYNFGKRHGSAYNKSIKEDSSDCFEDASNTARTFSVFLSDFTTALCSK